MITIKTQNYTITIEDDAPIITGVVASEIKVPAEPFVKKCIKCLKDFTPVHKQARYCSDCKTGAWKKETKKNMEQSFYKKQLAEKSKNSKYLAERAERVLNEPADIEIPGEF